MKEVGIGQEPSAIVVQSRFKGKAARGRPAARQARDRDGDASPLSSRLRAVGVTLSKKPLGISHRDRSAD
jgi:hypothetical protein